MHYKKQPTYPLKALDKSLAILEILSQDNSPLSIAELSERLDIYPSTIHRILDTLRYWGYVEQNPDTQRYQLAYLGEEEREKIIRGKGLASLTKNTITCEGKLGQEISKIREQGFAEDRGEHEEDVRCIAAPIRNHQDKVIAAISISGPAFRLNTGRRRQLRETLIQISKKICTRLGYRQVYKIGGVC